MIGNNLLMAGDEGYNLTRSLRFRASASAYLSRTPASAGNQQIWTWSDWGKRGTLGVQQDLFTAGTTGPTTSISFSSADALVFYTTNALVSASEYQTTNAVFRDPAAYYHILVSVDTTQATYANRVKIYINGVQQSVTVVNQNTQITLNATLGVNRAQAHNISRFVYASNQYFDGYLAEVNFIDGQALTPSSFGEFDTTTGVWKPKAYTGTYGTNGFYLPFTDNSALTTSSNVGLGKDFSGNGNYWTTNNISITAGVTYDSMTDVPTLTGADAANFAVLNPLDMFNASGTFAFGNLLYTSSNAGSVNSAGVVSTIAVPSGTKMYFEFVSATGTYPLAVGIRKAGTVGVSNQYIGYSASEYVYSFNGNKINNNTATAYGATFTSGDYIGCALDLVNGTVTFYKNGVSQGVAFTGLSGNYFFAVGTQAGANTCIGYANFGQYPFTYTPPSGFVSLNAYNLPDSTIKQGNKVMDATLYNGTGSAQTITNAAGFKPDLVWQKARAEVAGHRLVDSVRGATKVLYSSGSGAEATTSGVVDSFNSNGFTGGGSDVVTSGLSSVAWQWQAGQGVTNTNTNGTITSTVSVNASAGFSVVTFNIGSSVPPATVGHGLGVAPSLIIAKDRTSTGGWPVFHSSVTNQNQYLVLNGTGAVASATNVWGSSLPTSSVFGVTAGVTLGANSNCVAYCWAEIPGFSKFGSYTGNGSANGTFVYTGFNPKFILIKSSSTTYAWFMEDSARNVYNGTSAILQANDSAAEVTGTAYNIDFLSNGFKLATPQGNINGSGTTFIYAAFAENPFKNSLAR